MSVQVTTFWRIQHRFAPYSDSKGMWSYCQGIYGSESDAITALKELSESCPSSAFRLMKLTEEVVLNVPSREVSNVFAN